MALKRDPGKKRLTVDLPADIYREFKIYCVRKDTKMADEMRKMIKALLKRKVKQWH